MQDKANVFSTILASTVHDMKNSLGMMLDALNSILEELPDEKHQNSSRQYSVVQYESSRVNSSLMQLLALYKIENNQLPFNPGFHNLFDFIEEQALSHWPLFSAKGFTYQVDIDDELEAVFDESLMAMVVANVIGNAIRYAHSQILIRAEVTDVVTIIIYDDGPGYPAQMLELTDDFIQGINQDTGSTGLGLFFAQKVALLHKHGKKSGNITLSNGGALGGGVFKITIP